MTLRLYNCHSAFHAGKEPARHPLFTFRNDITNVKSGRRADPYGRTIEGLGVIILTLLPLLRQN